MDLKRESIQFNSQDLDQEQNMDVNPVQLNTQSIRIFINNKENDFSGKISGVTYLEKGKVAANAKIELFFGCKSDSPVLRTNSDNNGNYVIDNLPPGFYIMVARNNDGFKYQSHYIKVLPCQNVHHSILLK
ncbi:MAG TPA: carboxypeptidase regulatory-like domain-containing protein [Clostridiaceae bacterium]|nr:carboxypeptidase regulatory-like domain-containing protein [Clostridiaceae bacterium]